MLNHWDAFRRFASFRLAPLAEIVIEHDEFWMVLTVRSQRFIKVTCITFFPSVPARDASLFPLRLEMNSTPLHLASPSSPLEENIVLLSLSLSLLFVGRGGSRAFLSLSLHLTATHMQRFEFPRRCRHRRSPRSRAGQESTPPHLTSAMLVEFRSFLCFDCSIETIGWEIFGIGDVISFLLSTGSI